MQEKEKVEKRVAALLLKEGETSKTGLSVGIQARPKEAFRQNHLSLPLDLFMSYVIMESVLS